MASRREASRQRRQSILDAGLACFEEGGEAAITIEALRERSGASTGSLYHHFGNKDGVVAALFQWILDDYRQGLNLSLEGEKSAREFVRAIVLHHVHWAARDPVRARYLTQVRRSRAIESIETELRQSTGDMLREIGRRLHGYVAAGEVVDLPRALYAPLVIGPSQEVLRHLQSGRLRVDLDEVAEQLADAAWKSIRRDKN